jgi:hypothetical protein
MRRLLMGLAVAALMAAMMAVMAAPAMAQVNFGFDDRDDFNRFRDLDDFDDFDFDNENESESAPVEQEFKVVNFGDYANQCVPAVQFGNSGNFNNAPSFFQFGSEADDFEPGGIEFAFEPELAVDCSNTVQQSSAASSYYWAGYWDGYWAG